jgi:hypothetical protein
LDQKLVMMKNFLDGPSDDLEDIENSEEVGPEMA